MAIFSRVSKFLMATQFVSAITVAGCVSSCAPQEANVVAPMPPRHPVELKEKAAPKDVWGILHVQTMLPHATFYKQKLYGFFEKVDDPRLFGITAIQTQNSHINERNRYLPFGESNSAMHLRHGIRHGCLWRSIGHRSLFQMPLDDLELIDISSPKWNKYANYGKKYLRFKDPWPDQPRHGFGLNSLELMYESLASAEGGLAGDFFKRPARAVAGFGVVPTALDRCKTFVLPRDARRLEVWDSAYIRDPVNGCWKPKPRPGFAKIDAWLNDLDSPSFKKRLHARAELEALGYAARASLEKFIAAKPSDEARGRAEEVLEKAKQAPRLCAEAFNHERFPSLFVEEFHVFLRANDYYFVTESGKIFHAPAPKAGEKSRVMRELWTDAKRPIVAVIEDADRDKIWLFAKDRNKGAKLDFYFELEHPNRAESFDPAKLRPVAVEGRAKLLLEYLPLITPAKK